MSDTAQPLDPHWRDHFICEVGAARSGTNFLGEVLSQHPELAYWRRPKYIWRYGNAWQSDDCLTPADARPGVVRYIHRQFGDFLARSGRQRLLVCTQANSLSLGFVHAVFPRGKIVHIIRNGREVAASQKEEWQTHNSLLRAKGSRPPYYKLVYNRVREVPLVDLPAYAAEFVGTTWTMLAGSKYRYSMGPKIKNWQKLKREMDRMAFTAYTWRECVTAARSFGKTLPADQYYEIRFEDLVGQPEASVPPLLEFLGLPPSQEVDDFIARRVDRSVSGKWLSRLTAEELEIIEPYVADLCRELGYGEARPSS
ncbi:MAG: sulfotransferase [Pirellulales bacterium]|nr:sulfotransferase [Pirellulales bacterium]